MQQSIPAYHHAERRKQAHAALLACAHSFLLNLISASSTAAVLFLQLEESLHNPSVMWRLRPVSAGNAIIDLDASASAALPTDGDAETWSTKRRRKDTPRPSSLSAGKPLSELDKQRQESVATALQLYSNPEEAGIKLLLPSAMDLTDNPFTHCPTEQLATSCLHSQWAPFAIFGRLLDGLPSMQDSRHSSPSIDQPSDYKSIFFGAYSQGPLVGLRAQTRRYPMVSRLLNAVLYTLSGDHHHSTVFLSRNRAMCRTF